MYDRHQLLNIPENTTSGNIQVRKKSRLNQSVLYRSEENPREKERGIFFCVLRCKFVTMDQRRADKIKESERQV